MYKLNVKKTISIQDTIYEVKAIIVHHGQNVEEGHYTTYTINGKNTYHINDIMASNANIKLNKTYVTCDNITDDGRTAMVFYEKIKEPSADIIRANIPTMDQLEARVDQMRLEVIHNQNTNTQQQISDNDENSEEQQQNIVRYTTLSNPTPTIT